MIAPDLFGGPGGWDYGARRLGVHAVGLEKDPWVCATRRAAGLATIEADVAAFDPAEFYAARRQWAERFGLLGSPPCQTFSKAGRGEGYRDRDKVIEALHQMAFDGLSVADAASYLDERTVLVLEPLRWILALQPAWVALEQVPAVLPVYQAYAEILTELGYSAAAANLSAEQYGVPQTRRRAFLIAHRHREARFPEPTHRAYRKGAAQAEGDPELLPWLSMADGIGWGMTQRPYLTLSPGAIAEETAHAKSSGADAMLLGGGHARQIVMNEWQAGRWRMKSQHGVPRHTRPIDEPAFTVTSHIGRHMWQTIDEGDWYSVRRISITEAALLQSFPADYPWALDGGVTRVYGQIGSAVPPRLAEQVLASLLGQEVAA